MKFINAIQNRYSTKLYDPSKALDDSTIAEIAEILRLSPSSINSQPWRFTLITDPSLKAQLAKESYFNKQKIEDAPLLVVFSVCNNLDKFYEQISKELPQPNVDYYNSVVKPQGESAIKCWLKNQLYISIGVLLSACATMEIDSTPMEGINPMSYDTLIDNAEYHAVVAVAVGFRSAADKNQIELTPKQRRKMDDVVVIRKASAHE